MEDARTLNRRYETVAWGAFFILFGITSLVPGLPAGVGEIGIGIILLALNLVRYMSKLPTSGFTITLGIIALALGAADMARALINPGLELPVFPLLLIIVGAIWLVRGLTRR